MYSCSSLTYWGINIWLKMQYWFLHVRIIISSITNNLHIKQRMLTAGFIQNSLGWHWLHWFTGQCLRLHQRRVVLRVRVRSHYFEPFSCKECVLLVWSLPRRVLHTASQNCSFSGSLLLLSMHSSWNLSRNLPGTPFMVHCDVITTGKGL